MEMGAIQAQRESRRERETRRHREYMRRMKLERPEWYAAQARKAYEQQKAGKARQRAARAAAELSGPFWERPFWRRVHPEALSGCWLWHGAVTDGGYGKLQRAGRKVLAHREAYALACGDPGGLLVCHSCDNPGCVNPDHLFLGTIADNNLDRHAKGRSARGEALSVPMRGDANPSRRMPERQVRGESHPARKLCSEDVSRIRERVAAGETHLAVARDYSVSRSTVSRIVRGKLWS